MSGETGDTYVDLIPDDMALARSHLAAGLPGLAEGVLRRHIARLEAGGRGAAEQLDVARGALAEALWHQGRPLEAQGCIDEIRPGSLERVRAVVLLIEAEATAVAGHPERAEALMERVIESVGVDEAWRIRGGVPSRLAWPNPASLRPTPRRPATGPRPGPAPASAAPPSPERTAAAHARLEAARMAYGAGHAYDGDRELGLALRLDPRVAAEGVTLVEPTLGPEPAAERLLLYGDLLRAADRPAEAAEAYDRAAHG